MTLFDGQPITEKEVARATRSGKPGGYADIPGTGPVGEMCKTCASAIRYGAWAKCCLYPYPTHGRATDILLRTLACRKWTKGERA